MATVDETDHHGSGRMGDVVVDDRHIAYFEAGDGPRTCLLLHGLAASLDYWAHTIPALTESHRVIAVDLPGFGRSEMPETTSIDGQLATIPAFLDALGVQRCDVVGHSMGTLVACELTARYPHRVDRLVLTGGPITSVIELFNSPIRTVVKNPKVLTFLVEVLTASLRPPDRLRRLVVSSRLARWMAFRAYVPHPAALGADDVARILVGVGAPAVLPTLRHGFGFDLTPALAAVSRPTIVIAGERDTICPPSDSYRFAASNSSVQSVHVIDGVGHWPMIESPEEFNAILVEFLSRDEPRAAHGTGA